MATITRSAGAMLGAVASAADAVSKTITVAASSVSLLENYVDEALHNQMGSSDERQRRSGSSAVRYRRSGKRIRFI